jgi:phage terminase large subunit
MTNQAQIERIPVYDFSDPLLYNAAYIHLFGVKNRFLHMFGSAGSGKSNFGFQREIVESYEPHRKNRKTMVVRQTYNTLKDSCYADLKSVIYDWELQDDFEILKSPLSITNKITGVEFIFRGLDDVEKIKSVKGVDRIIIEEATEIESSKDLDQLSLRLRGFEEVQIVLMYNPVDEFHWLNTNYHQSRDDDHYILKTTYKDNRFLDSAYIKSLEKLQFTNANYYQVYVLGNWGTVVEGLIYDSYEIVNDLPSDEIQFYGLDFGYSDPTALVAMKVEDASPKKKLITKEILYKAGLDGVGLVAEFDRLKVRKDVWIVGDSARPEMIASLKNAGYKVRGCEKGAGSVLTGINRVRKYQICIVAGSKNGIKEIQNYQKKEVNGIWFEDPAPNQVEHYWDAVRYGEQAVAIYTPEPEETVEEDQEW